MEYKIVDTFQKRLVELIKFSGLSQIEFSKKVELSRSLINRYVHRGDHPKGERIVQIANCFQINPLWLMGVDVPMNSIVTPKDIVYDIPVIKDITEQNLFSIKNYNGICSNIVTLDTNYQYLYYDESDTRYLIQIKKTYNENENVVTLNKNKIKIETYKNISSEIVIGKLISIIYKN